MNRYRWKTAAALLGLGLFCGCAATNNSCAEPRQGLFSRWFGQRSQQPACDCIETGRVTVGDGPVIPEPGYVTPGVVVPPSAVPTMPPPTALPTPTPFAPPAAANPSSRVKDTTK